MPGAERDDPNYLDVILERRLRQALVRLSPDLPAEALEDAFRKLTRTDGLSLVERNRERRVFDDRFSEGSRVIARSGHWTASNNASQKTLKL